MAPFFHGGRRGLPSGVPATLTWMRHVPLALVAALLALPAQAQYFRCETDSGVPEYTNAPTSAQRPNCRRVDLPVITTIPSAPVTTTRGTVPAPSGAAAGGAPGAAGASAGTAPSGAAGAPGAAGSAAAAASPSPSNFPRVDPAVQRLRDADRRRILEDELRKEEARLAELRREFNNGEPERRAEERQPAKYFERVQKLRDDIGRSEGNVASLRRELSALRD